jgi:hypothetical protein
VDARRNKESRGPAEDVEQGSITTDLTPAPTSKERMSRPARSAYRGSFEVVDKPSPTEHLGTPPRSIATAPPPAVPDPRVRAASKSRASLFWVLRLTRPQTCETTDMFGGKVFQVGIEKRLEGRERRATTSSTHARMNVTG